MIIVTHGCNIFWSKFPNLIPKKSTNVQKQLFYDYFSYRKKSFNRDALYLSVDTTSVMLPVFASK